MDDYDSGKFWAGQFLARLIKTVSEKKQRQNNKNADNISEVNERKKYS